MEKSYILFYQWDYNDNAIAEYIREEFSNDYSEAQRSLENKTKKKFDTKIHCVIGEKNISLLPFRTDVKNIILYHHEKLDGSGYPFGLKGEILSFEEKLLACIDIYQAFN